MKADPATMPEEELRRYRQAVAALVAASLQRLRDYPLPDERSPEPER